MTANRRMPRINLADEPTIRAIPRFAVIPRERAIRLQHSTAAAGGTVGVIGAAGRLDAACVRGLGRATQVVPMQAGWSPCRQDRLLSRFTAIRWPLKL